MECSSRGRHRHRHPHTTIPPMRHSLPSGSLIHLRAPHLTHRRLHDLAGTTPVALPTAPAMAAYATGALRGCFRGGQEMAATGHPVVAQEHLQLAQSAAVDDEDCSRRGEGAKRGFGDGGEFGIIHCDISVSQVVPWQESRHACSQRSRCLGLRACIDTHMSATGASRRESRMITRPGGFSAHLD